MNPQFSLQMGVMRLALSLPHERAQLLRVVITDLSRGQLGKGH
jgi:hypothetical protein